MILPHCKSTNIPGGYQSWFVDDPQSRCSGPTLFASFYALLRLRFPGFEWSLEAPPLERVDDAPDVIARQEFEGDVCVCGRAKEANYWFCLSCRVFVNSVPVFKEKLGDNQFRPDLALTYCNAKGLLRKHLEKKQA